MLSKFKIPKTTLHRILSCSTEWNESGMKVERKWNNNLLKISILSVVDGTEVERKWNGSGMKSAKKRQKKSLQHGEEIGLEMDSEKPNKKVFPEMVRIYDEFCKQKIGVGAKMDSLQGKSLKSIIDFLSTQIKTKQGENISEQQLNESILTSWQLILSKWDLVNGFYAEQVKLSQINANLPNILIQIKSNKTNKRDAKFNNIENEIGNVNFE